MSDQYALLLSWPTLAGVLVGGKAAATRKKYLFYAKRFCQYRFASGEADWSTLRAQDLVGFVQQEAARLKRKLGRPPAVALRAMLRFLVAEGQVPRGLEIAIPMPRQWARLGHRNHFGSLHCEAAHIAVRQNIERRPKPRLPTWPAVRCRQALGPRLPDHVHANCERKKGPLIE